MKIIRRKDRIICVKKEKDDPRYWFDLFDQLTFAEGVCLDEAYKQWLDEKLKIKNKGDDRK